MPIFGRTVVLDLGQAGAPGKRYNENRVAFRVDHKKGGEPSTATIQLWNPLPALLSILDAGPFPTARLLVGYGDALAPAAPTIPRQIYLGDIVKNGLRVSKQGPDRIVTVTCKDGGKKVQQTNLNLVFATPVTYAQVIAAAAAQAALPVGSIVVPPTTLPHGGAFVGNMRTIFNRIARSTNTDWMIRDGVLYFAPRGAPVVLGFVPVFSATRGNLIGSPTKKDKGAVEVKALIDAGLRPGGSFVLESRSPTTSLPVTATYVAGDVSFIGDSGFDTPFYVQTIGHVPGVT